MIIFKKFQMLNVESLTLNEIDVAYGAKTVFQDLCSQGNKNNLDRFIFTHFLFVYKKA